MYFNIEEERMAERFRAIVQTLALHFCRIPFMIFFAPRIMRTISVAANEMSSLKSVAFNPTENIAAFIITLLARMKFIRRETKSPSIRVSRSANVLKSDAINVRDKF